MLFIFYWCHHNSISGREKQSAFIVYLIKFHLTEMMICNQRLNLRRCAKWKAAITNTTSTSGLVSNVKAVLSRVDAVVLINVTPQGHSRKSDELILWHLSDLSAALFWCNNDGAAGHHGTLNCESLSRGRRRVRYVSGLVCCLSYLLGDDSNDNTRQSGKFIFDEPPGVSALRSAHLRLPLHRMAHLTVRSAIWEPCLKLLA